MVSIENEVSCLRMESVNGLQVLGSLCDGKASPVHDEFRLMLVCVRRDTLR